MTAYDDKRDILKRIEALAPSIEKAYLTRTALLQDDSGHDMEATGAESISGAGYIEALYDMIEQDQPIFGLEPWHALEDTHGPAEMLLRLKKKDGSALAPYPFVMLCYNGGLTAELDTILLMRGLQEFRDGNRKKASQISINISARSLRHEDFTRIALRELKKDGNDVVFEIHETSHTTINPDILKLFKKKGVRFALDDVILNLSDMMRLSYFDKVTSFMKLDHKLLTDSHYTPLLGPTMAFIVSSVGNSRVVAEGVRSVEDAEKLYDQYPQIKFVQGRDLPDIQSFSKEWKKK